MLLPTSYGATVLTLVLTALFWGIWANTQRAARKWRFELYAYDFALGSLAITLLLALTLGNAGSGDTFTFDDSLTVSSRRSIGTVVGGGVVYCVGNLMILAGVALAGMSTALPVASGVALAAAAAASWGSASNRGLVYGGAALGLLAVLAAGRAQRAAAAESPVRTGMHPGWKGFILSCVGGAITGISLPIVELGRGGDIGVGGYGAAMFMSLGILLMTPLVNLYFLNLPVQGEAVSPLAYLKGTAVQHMFGLLGGAIWGAGTTAFFASAGLAFAGTPKFLGIESLAYGGAVLGAVCGLALWGEQAGAPKARRWLFGALALLAGGAAMMFMGA